MQSIKATLERIVYYNEENNYLVARCSLVEKEAERFTVVGNVAHPAPGILLHIEGEWLTHPKYGKQFKLHSYAKIQPATEKGIEKYLGSGIIENIGPGLAARIVKHFGQESLKIIEENAERLEEVEGIGSKRMASIISAWDKQKKTKQVMLYLYSLGIGSATVNKIYATYRDEAPPKIQENPYRLAEDIFGIGFKKADAIAKDMGIRDDSPVRLKAGVHHTLMQSTDQGHIFLPREEVTEKADQLLQVEEHLVERTIIDLEQKGELMVEDGCVYHPHLYSAEVEVANMLKRTIQSGRKTLPLGWEQMIQVLEQKQNIALSSGQKRAIQTALTEKVMVITGGPGTGKTTTLKSIVLLFEEFHLKVFLAAPTGRAAKRLSQATERRASTIHRLLGYTPGQGFTRNQNNKLKADVLIVDEVSMVDILLMRALLKAVPSSCRLVLVGDADQLPAVGPGNLLQDIIQSGVVSVVKLEEIFRQAEKSLIVVNAHRINKGQFPVFTPPQQDEEPQGQKDFYFLWQSDATKAEEMIINLYCQKIPQQFGFDPFLDIQIVSPLYKGPAGVTRLNSIIQGIVNPEGCSLVRGQTIFRTGDKVMQLKNNYEKDVFNGDIGIVHHVDSKEGIMSVSFPEKNVRYQGQDFNQLTLAYAVSVHKSQGSEYPVIIMPVLMSHYIMLQRNLLYTGLTRAKKLAFLIGDRRALAIGIRNNKVAKRYTKLAERLSTLAH